MIEKLIFSIVQCCWTRMQFILKICLIPLSFLLKRPSNFVVYNNNTSRNAVQKEKSHIVLE